MTVPAQSEGGSPAPPAIVILAGGEGRRIGGGKARRMLSGRSLVDRVVDRARAWSDEIAIAVRDPRSAPRDDLSLLLDDPAIPGPLAGIASALRHAAAIGRDRVMTLPCDTPFLPRDLPARLAEAIGSAGVAVPMSAGRLHPACALWRCSALAGLPAYLDGGGRSLLGFAEKVGLAATHWPVDRMDPFFNINDAEDLAAAENWLKRA